MARELLEAYGNDDLQRFPAVFNELEVALVSASPQERNLLIVGFIEDLQNLTLNANLPLLIWGSWLGPRSLEGWRAVEGAWSGRVSPDRFNRFVDRGESFSDS